MNNKILTIRNHNFIWGQKTFLMGILNVTPDSFSDGGDFYDLSSSIAQVEHFVNYNVDIIDIGGQSTRPGAIQVSLDEELSRVIPIIKSIRAKGGKYADIPISIDTNKSKVAQLAIAAGADLINDISAGTFDDKMLSTVAKLNVPIILMHIKGKPENMQSLTDYQDLIGEVYAFLEERILAAIKAGINPDKIIIDPGIGFAKNYMQNIELLRNLERFKKLGYPLLIGVSRKSFIGHILNESDPKKRIWGTLGANCIAIANGADILRVHDVAEMQDIIKVVDVILRTRE